MPWPASRCSSDTHKGDTVSNGKERKEEAKTFRLSKAQRAHRSPLGGSGDLVSKVISPLIGVISNYKYSYLTYNPSY